MIPIAWSDDIALQYHRYWKHRVFTHYSETGDGSLQTEISLKKASECTMKFLNVFVPTRVL